MMYFFNKNWLSALMVLVSVAIFLMFIQPKYSEISDLRFKQSEYKKYLDDAEEVRIIRGRLLATKSSIPEDQWNKLKRIVPDRLDETELLLNLDGLVSAQGALFLSFESKKISETASTPPVAGFDFETPSPVPAAQNTTGGYDILEFTVNIKTSYLNLLRILSEIERELQLIDVVGVKIKSQKESDGIYDIQITARSYRLSI